MNANGSTHSTHTLTEKGFRLLPSLRTMSAAQRSMPIDKSKLDHAIALARAFGATRLILFGSALQNPAAARDLDLACDGVAGWKLFELGARLEEELQTPLDLVPLSPPSRFTRHIEARGKVLL